MPNSRHTSLIDSPSSNLATNCRRSSITEHSFHGIDTSRSIAESVTHVSGTPCYLCVGPLKRLGLAKPSPPPPRGTPVGPFIHRHVAPGGASFQSARRSRHAAPCTIPRASGLGWPALAGDRRRHSRSAPPSNDSRVRATPLDLRLTRLQHASGTRTYVADRERARTADRLRDARAASRCCSWFRSAAHEM